MKITISYNVSDDDTYCCGIDQEKKCPNLKWGQGKCTAFGKQLEWDEDQGAFRKIKICKDGCTKSKINSNFH